MFLLGQQTFKPWSDEEEKTLEELLREKINTVVWNESGDNNKIMQARKQIMVKFKEQFPVSKHNEADIVYIVLAFLDLPFSQFCS